MSPVIIDPTMSTVDVAKYLLGKEFLVQTSQGPLGGIITDTEAYTQDDPASHSYQGRQTPRNVPMFSRAGQIYVYFIYGMYFCLNIVTEQEGVGAAVLIRGLKPTHGRDLMEKNRGRSFSNLKGLSDGPGKLAQAMGVDLSWNHYRIDQSPISLNDIGHTPCRIDELPRVGISQATTRLWRFVIADS